jgi:ubiquinone biosynthesis protein UbiJ
MALLSPAHYANAAAGSLLGNLDWARDKLRPFAGRTVHLSAWPMPGIALRAKADGNWEDATLDSPQQADVRLRISPAMLPRLAGSPDKPGSAVDGDGDPEFLQTLRDIADVLPLALEERLSSVVGPIAAHGVASAMRALAAWPAVAAERVNAGIGAYVTEESQALLKKSTLAAFSTELQEIAARVDRLTDAASLAPPRAATIGQGQAPLGQ